MAKHRAEARHLRTGVAGLGLVLALWCTGDGAPPSGVVTAAGAPAAPPTGAGSLPLRQAAPPVPRPDATAAEPAPAPEPAPSPRRDDAERTLPASEPVALAIGPIGLQSRLMALGQRADRGLEVPPEAPGSPAGWYRHSPTPGELGPSVVLGHVNATGGGPGVFADLQLLVPGDEVRVTRQDGSTAVFAVDAVERYAKDAFPTLRVYGNTDRPELRLITCDGYDPATGSFDANLVVHASLARD